MEKLKRWNVILNTIMGSFIGVFIGHSVYRYYDYKKHPIFYEAQSSPWYASIQISGLVAAIVIFISIMVKFLIKNNLKK